MPDELKNIPRYAIYRNRKVRITGYEDGKFHILDSDDAKRLVTREALTFLPGKKK